VSTFGAITTGLAFVAARIFRQQRLTTPSKDDPAHANLRADIYYPIIARAITQLPSNECEARQRLYERARAALANKLHGQDSSCLTHERQALELAIRRVEEVAKVQEIIRQKLGDPPEK
jgi:hypothetical protein